MIKKLAILVASLCLGGCMVTVDQNQINLAVNYCYDKGGVDYFGIERVHCNNGSVESFFNLRRNSP